MKRQAALASKLQGDSTSGHYTRTSYDDSNPYVYNYTSDSEPISEQSRKIQKKRDTYQKIPDDVRVQILESVQNGETLKSAAKRFQINYSSAKSILHTYRKEGRILKKSAQERTTKKKVTSDDEEDNVKPTKQAAKPLKKETVKSNKKTVAPLAERTTSASTCASYNEDKSSPIQANDSLTLKMEQYEAQQSRPAVHEDYVSPLESFNMNRASRQTGMPIDSYYMKYSDFHYPEIGGDYYSAEYNNMHYPAEFDAMNVLQPRLPKNEEPFHGTNSYFYQKGFGTGYNFEDKPSRGESGLYYEENLENAGNPLKSFMDSQMMLQEAFKKTNFWTGTGNQGFRKSSFDMF